MWNNSSTFGSAKSGDPGNKAGSPAASAGTSAGTVSSERSEAEVETWMILEYCDKGSLQVRRTQRQHQCVSATSLAHMTSSCQAGSRIQIMSLLHGMSPWCDLFVLFPGGDRVLRCEKLGTFADHWCRQGQGLDHRAGVLFLFRPRCQTLAGCVPAIMATSSP